MSKKKLTKKWIKNKQWKTKKERKKGQDSLQL